MADELVRLAGRQRKKDYYRYAWRQFAGIIPGLVPQSRVRVWPFTVLMVVVGMVLAVRLAQLTMVEGSYRRELAEGNRIVAIRRAAARGVLFDRNGLPLTRNVPAYKRQVPGTTVAQAQFEEVSRSEALILSRQSGERVFFDIKRDYLCGRAGANLLGYLGEVSADELGAGRDYVMGDLIGKTGIEKVYEEELRGVPGSELVEVDATGKMVREMGQTAARQGLDIDLTIDMGLQQVLYEALEGKPGAVVAQVPATGEVLAIVTSPAFDPNDVAGSLNEADMPFFNRALGGAYPPGSVFKIVTATAGLEEGKIDANTKILDTGEIVIGSYRYGNWLYDSLGRTDGELTVVRAMKRSNDIFFYKVGEYVGAGVLADWARLFGFGSDAGLVSLGAVKGLVPDPMWKERYKGERWFLGNTYHMAIGQGDMLATPMQVNRMAGAIAARGSLCKPVLTKREVGRESCTQLNLAGETLELVSQGMVEACMPGGTAAVFNDFVPQVACKTGTAEHTHKEALPHAWFTVYAPAVEPEIVVTVMLESIGQGSTEAAPVAKKALEYWFGIDEEVEVVGQEEE